MCSRSADLDIEFDALRVALGGDKALGLGAELAGRDGHVDVALEGVLGNVLGLDALELELRDDRGLGELALLRRDRVLDGARLAAAERVVLGVGVEVVLVEVLASVSGLLEARSEVVAQVLGEGLVQRVGLGLRADVALGVGRGAGEGAALDDDILGVRVLYDNGQIQSNFRHHL